MRSTFLLICLLQVTGGFSQQKYWVYVNSNDIANKTAVKRYLETNDCAIVTYSDWLNAYSVSSGCNLSSPPAELTSSIKPVALFEQNRFNNSKEPKLGFALEQINANKIIEKDLTGKGVKIGIIDGGFLEADKDPRLSHLFKNKQVIAYRDFVTPALGPFEGSKHLGDDHGNEVWHMIGGKDPETEVQFGMATGADFYLARTDDGRTDFRAEEDYLVAALEWMDSLGVKLVNISIGYSIGFENALENYKPTDMDGKSVALTRAAQIAASEKGMLLVVAGGNDGNLENFQVVSTPADAKDVLAVGATGYKTWQKLKYSSIGAEFLNYVKPDVSCFSSQGTSFSAPIITGLAAVIWEGNPELTNMEVKDLITSSGHLANNPNNYLGYGVPDANQIFNILNNDLSRFYSYEEIESRKTFKLDLQDAMNNRMVIFHKKNKTIVMQQQIEKITGSSMRLRKPEGAQRSTIISGKNVTEIIWRDN